MRNILVTALIAATFLLISCEEEAPSPTATEPAPTETATATVVPASPTPIATPTPGLSAAEQAYLAQVVELSDTLKESLTRAAELFGAPAIGDAEWTISLAAELATWQVAAQEARELKPPSRFAEFHSLFVDALGDLEAAADLVAQGIDNLDPDLVSRGTEKMEAGTRKIREATQLLERLTP